MLQQLFQPFNRLGQERSTEDRHGHRARDEQRLVELMGGEIGVESEVGSGSVFWFELNSAVEPRLETNAAEPSTIAPANNGHGAPLRTLLYVEDNPANLKLIEQLIARRPDIRLLSARDGSLGVRLARTQSART